ncbi:MAG: hypothetical protein BWY72_02431 [Bacteroidetes bacterium ADurb.Bin416]|nr:MAG: hypothetical protein BWY72_02431 [Bacteroidetes bacterium ADurb.Bin416]
MEGMLGSEGNTLTSVISHAIMVTDKTSIGMTVR